MLQKNLFKLLFFSVIALFFYCCTSEGGDKEPNNSIDQAVAINSDQEFTIKINPKGDVDWFKIEIPEQGYLKIKANQIPEQIGLEVLFAKLQEWEGKKQKTIRGWHKLPDALFVEEAGTYYFVLQDDYSDQFSEEEILIKVEFIKEFDMLEPNNSVEKAKEIKLNSEIKPAIYPKGDNDWFKFKVEKQGYVTVKSKNVEGEITPEISFAGYDAWADKKIETIRNWHKLPDACAFADTGYYYILLHDDYDDQCCEKPFDLKIDFVDEFDKYEPNNDFKKADTVNRGDTLIVAVFPKGDHDYFKINITEGDTISFLAKDFEGITPELSLFTINPEDENKLTRVRDWKKLPAKFEVETGKEYYILLHDDYDDKCSMKPFEFRIE